MVIYLKILKRWHSQENTSEAGAARRVNGHPSIIATSHAKTTYSKRERALANKPALTVRSRQHSPLWNMYTKKQKPIDLE